MSRTPWQRRGAVLLSLAALVGCTQHAATGSTTGPPGGGPLANGYLYGSASNPFLAVPPLAGQRPTVSATAARQDVQHPANWPSGAQMNDPITFGYGRVRSPQAQSAAGGTDPVFRQWRLAWVAIYRSSTAQIPVPPCVALASPPAGYHVAQPQHVAYFLIAVIVDGTTGDQATWDNLPPGCPQLARDVPRRDGRVVGRFLAIGGPPGAPAETQRGVVSLTGPHRRVVTVAVGPDGRFSVAAPAGTYRFAGRSPQFVIDDRQGTCNALHKVKVRQGRTTHANVYCQRR